MQALFDDVTYLENVASLIFEQPQNLTQQRFQVVYFMEDDSYQRQLYIDALMLAQRQKKQNDVIWISSLGNLKEETALTIKPALMVWPNQQSKRINKLTSQMDVAHTFIKNWLGCQDDIMRYSIGSDLLTLKKDRIIANTLNDSIMVFDKDKIGINRSKR